MLCYFVPLCWSMNCIVPKSLCLPIQNWLSIGDILRWKWCTNLPRFVVNGIMVCLFFNIKIHSKIRFFSYVVEKIVQFLIYRFYILQKPNRTLSQFFLPFNQRGFSSFYVNTKSPYFQPFKKKCPVKKTGSYNPLTGFP